MISLRLVRSPACSASSTSWSTRIQEIRAREAAATGATTVVTGCPFCLSMLASGAGAAATDERPLRTRDFVELVAEALVEGDGGAPPVALARLPNIGYTGRSPRERSEPRDAIAVEERTPVEPADDLRVVGRRLPKLDAPQKVVGKTAYAADLRMSGLLVGAILRSPHPHARIAAIDISAAEALPGVHAVIHAGNVEQRRFGYNHDNIPLKATRSASSATRSPRSRPSTKRPRAARSS